MIGRDGGVVHHVAEAQRRAGGVGHRVVHGPVAGGGDHEQLQGHERGIEGPARDLDAAGRPGGLAGPATAPVR